MAFFTYTREPDGFRKARSIHFHHPLAAVFGVADEAVVDDFLSHASYQRDAGDSKISFRLAVPIPLRAATEYR